MKTGKAYGFFDCRASKEEIEEQLPVIRDVSITPFGLELDLRRGVFTQKRDEDIAFTLLSAIEEGMKYTIEATHPNVSNQETAEELEVILEQVYQLFSNGKKSKGFVAYKENGEYFIL